MNSDCDDITISPFWGRFYLIVLIILLILTACEPEPDLIITGKDNGAVIHNNEIINDQYQP